LLEGFAEAPGIADSEQRPPEAERPPRRGGAPIEHYDDLAAEEVIALLPSLESDDLQALRDHERRHANRSRVLSAIDSFVTRI
ncbi:MAG: hypothetical protein ACRDLA_19715, partial [Thermoleophilaceae bacterium]